MYIAAAAIGLCVFMIVYGARHVIGASAYWQMPQVDERQALMGYRYFVHEPWHWPVFASHSINVPYVKSVAFLDCIPGWALLNKLVATIVPPWSGFSAHAYLGLWHALCYALQATFGVAVLRALGHTSWRSALVGALFFLAIPTWIFRYAHPALSAHWILLWALLLYLRTPVGSPGPRRLAVGWLAQLAVASLVTPYLVVISLPIYVASLVRTRDRRTIAVGLASGAATVLVLLWFAGYFGHEGGRPQWGFEYESANLLSWLVPLRSGFVGNARWLANVDGTGWQYEGYSYLGLGALVLFAWLAVHPREIAAAIRRHVVLFSFAAAFALVALSNHVYWGSHELISYPIPSVLRWFVGQYRSPGRFVWLPLYVLVPFLLHWTLNRRRGFALLAVATLLQVADARGDWAWQRVTATQPDFVLGNQEHWRRLVDAHDAVLVLPSYSCRHARSDASRYGLASIEIQMLASERALPINGTYSTRPLRRCSAEEAAWPTLPLRPNTLYVLLPEAAAIADRFEHDGATCVLFDFGRVCSAQRDPIDVAIRDGIARPTPAGVRERYDQSIDVAVAPLNETWSPPDGHGRWTVTSLASLRIALQGDAPADAFVSLRARSSPCRGRPERDVDVRIGDALVGTMHLDANRADSQWAFPLPHNVLSSHDVVLQLVSKGERGKACEIDTSAHGLWISDIRFGASGLH